MKNLIYPVDILVCKVWSQHVYANTISAMKTTQQQEKRLNSEGLK